VKAVRLKQSGATVSADQLPLTRLYSATGRACRRKWRYIKYTPLPLPFRQLIQRL